MNRLTKKDYKNGIQVNGYYTKKNAQRLTDISHKLGKLEDIEDELGCPLDVMFRVMEKGVEYIVKITSIDVCEPYTKETRIEHRENLKEIKLVKDVFRGNQYVFIVGYEPSKYGLKEDIVYLKDYKKTWWVKGERDEKAS